ncbi:hypothetical protein Tco_1213666 [Tanacetum coccineum]
MDDQDNNKNDKPSQQLNIWNSIVHRKRPPITISSYRDSLQIVDVFVKDGMEVQNGHPLFFVKRGEDLKAKDGTIIKHWHPYFIPDELRHELEEAGRQLAATDKSASKRKDDGPDAAAATLKRKAVSNDGLDDAIKIKKKSQAEYPYPTRTIRAHTAFRLTKVHVKAGMDVLKGGPLYAFELLKKENSSFINQMTGSSERAPPLPARPQELIEYLRITGCSGNITWTLRWTLKSESALSDISDRRLSRLASFSNTDLLGVSETVDCMFSLRDQIETRFLSRETRMLGRVVIASLALVGYIPVTSSISVGAIFPLSLRRVLVEAWLAESVAVVSLSLFTARGNQQLM